MPQSSHARSRSDSPTKSCTRDDCDRPLRARGLCNLHYKQMRGTSWAYATLIVSCDWCGVAAEKTKTDRYVNRFCTWTCRDAWRCWSAGIPTCSVPDSHPSRSSVVPPHHPSRIALSCTVPADHPSLLLQRRCQWCNADSGHLRYCDLDCKRRAKRARRRGREADGHTYTWSHVMRVLLLLDRCCAYCQAPIVGSPEPDHVVPLSRGGSNGSANILPACPSCNSDKRDLLLHEWASDRERRGKPPVRTVLDRSLPAFAHLLPDVFTSCAA